MNNGDVKHMVIAGCQVRQTLRSAAMVDCVRWKTCLGAAGLLLAAACSTGHEKLAAQNSLHQNTGEAGSTIPKDHPPYYPNTAGNIVAPPGNPAGNRAGDPPIVGGTENRQGGWPEGR